MRKYTQAEVRAKATQERVVVTHDGDVYDVTDFLHKHPGGAALIEVNAGNDITATLRDRRSHAHSQIAFQTLAKYRIGTLADQTSRRKTDQNCASNGHASKYSEDANEKIVCGGSKQWYQDTLVDWEAPLVSQMPRLGDKYFEWVHTPVLGHEIRFFSSSILEKMSFCPWWVIPVFWLPIVAWLFISARCRLASTGDSEVWMPFLNGGIAITLSRAPLLLLLGYFLWTFLEYAIHRWLFHLEPSSDRPWMVKLHFLMHGQHHKAPMDHKRLVFPPAPAFIAFFVGYSLLRLLFPPATAEFVSAGVVLGYICYDLTHYYCHYGSPTIPYLRRLKNYHIRHHFTDQQKGFGISAKFWDYPFGTLIPDDIQRSV